MQDDGGGGSTYVRVSFFGGTAAWRLNPVKFASQSELDHTFSPLSPCRQPLPTCCPYFRLPFTRDIPSCGEKPVLMFR